MAQGTLVPIQARIRAVSTHLPDRILGNEELAALYPEWPAEKILEKTGIRERRVAADDETAGDLAYAAAQALFEKNGVERDEIDFLILCTQAPDHILPTTACILQDRLQLRRDIGALDVNLGCSGFVYGLSLAAGLIAAGIAGKVLLLTADTYSKYINTGDKSVRTLFGDGAAATLIEAAAGETAGIGPFVFGTDGGGAGDLVVPSGGFRTPRSTETGVVARDASGNLRSQDDLYMDGAAVMTFSLREVPKTYRSLLEKTGLASDDVDHVILHQANKFMLDALQKKLGLRDAQVPRRYELIGNTVSSTIPFVIEDLLERGILSRGARVFLIGFGVGLSWAGAALTF